ncbi:MAG: ATP-binding protein, partial [Myxococcota bacterium]
LQNLISNAIKFRRDGVAPRCVVRVKSAEGGYVLSVEDNGIGIPSDQLTRIFDPFERLHGRERYEGNGIGLAIVRDSVEAMGGQIDVSSTVGEGSTFTVRASR